MRKKFPLLIISVILFSCLNLITAPLTALATTSASSAGTSDECSGSISAGVKCFGSTAYGQSEPTPLVAIIAGIVNILLAILAIVFLILIIYGGYAWMTAMGQEDKIKKAKQIIINAAIGLLIVILSYAIVNFVITLLINSAVFQGSGGQTTGFGG